MQEQRLQRDFAMATEVPPLQIFLETSIHIGIFKIFLLLPNCQKPKFLTWVENKQETAKQASPMWYYESK